MIINIDVPMKNVFLSIEINGLINPHVLVIFDSEFLFHLLYTSVFEFYNSFLNIGRKTTPQNLLKSQIFKRLQFYPNEIIIYYILPN